MIAVLGGIIVVFQQVQRKLLKRPQTTGMRVEGGNVTVDLREDSSR